MARILAKAMNCETGPRTEPCGQCRSCREITEGNAADVFEIDGASNNSVDQVRELRENLRYMPTHSRYKIYIIDEVHMLSLAAFNALLKTLEEPPAHVLFMFATTEVHKIPITILSRCQRHDLRRIEAGAIAAHLTSLCRKEQVDIDNQSVDLIAREAEGCMRDALSLMDHVLACAQGPVSAELICDLLGIAERDHLFSLSDAVFNRDLSRVLKGIDEVWRQGYEINRFYSDLVAHFHHLALVKMGTEAVDGLDLPAHEVQRMQQQVAGMDATALLQLFDLLFQAEGAIKHSSQPRFALEMTFLKLFQTPTNLSIDTLIDKLDDLRQGVVVQTVQAAPDVPTPGDSMAPSGNETAVDSPDDGPSANPSRSDGALSEHQTAELDSTDLWKKIVKRVGKEKQSLAAMLKKCRLSVDAENKLALEVRENDFAFKSISKQKDMLTNLCCEVSGRQVELEIIPNFEDAAAKKKIKQKNARLEQEALGHPMVMEALKLFDGKVVDVSIPKEV